MARYSIMQYRLMRACIIRILKEKKWSGETIGKKKAESKTRYYANF
jgi:hypothetical protein